MAVAQVFIYLQLLDLLTTLVGFKMGAGEASPFIRMLMQAGPATGVAVSKLIALALGGLCVYLNKQHLIRWATYWYGALVVWNLIVILSAPGRIG
jgi:apolipoprotein N-acyltransferase